MFVYDLLGAQNRDHGERGIARYILHLALALQRQEPGLVDEFWVHDHLPIPGSLEPLIRTGRVKRKTVEDMADAPSSTGLFLAGSMFELGEPLDRVVPSWARGPGWASMAVLYDLIPLRFADWYLTDPIVRYQYLTRLDATTSLDHLLAISQATADDGTELGGVPAAKMSVIGAGADSRFRLPDEPLDAIASKLRKSLPELEGNYVLFPSGIEQRKNVDGMLEAYAALPEATRNQHQLVLVCRVTDHERVVLDRQATELGIEGQFITTGYVSDEVLVQLYQAALLVVFPAIYEGFGLPVLEGMRCGAPVICSDSSSLREIQLDPTARFDPEDISDITSTMERFLADPDERRRLVEAEPSVFSWDRAAQITAVTARSILQTLPRKIEPVRRLPTLALISPLPPEATGIAVYAERFLRSLVDHFEVTVFTDLDEAGIGSRLPHGAWQHDLGSFDLLESEDGKFDHVLYFLGNSRFHVDAYELLRRRGGSVFLHDIRLTGLHNEIQRLAPERLDGGSVGSTLAAMYPNRYQPSLEQEAVISAELANRFGVFMAKGVTDAADDVFVHSEFAADLLELDTGERPNVLFEVPVFLEEKLNDVQRSTSQIVSFGIVDPAKSPERIIDAHIEISRTRPDVELVFVGGVDPTYKRELEQRAEMASVPVNLKFIGHADETSYSRYLDSATVAVQLRSLSNGESSGTLAENMAAGTPLIVTNIGAQSELPDEVAIKVEIDVSSADLALAILSILSDQDLADRLSSAGRQRAALLTYDVASGILAKHLNTQGSRSVVVVGS